VSVEREIFRALVDAGAGFMIALVMLIGLYRIARSLGTSFIEAQNSQAEALGAQAQSVAGLTASIQDFVRSDNTEHREMLVLLRFIAQKQRSFDEVRSEHINRKKQAHTHCTIGTP
jgi:hypothetical protein